MLRVIDVVYGPLSGWPKLIRRLMKLIVFGVLGWLTHWLILSTLLTFEKDRVLELQALQTEISSLADLGNPFSFEFCMSPEYAKGVDIPACTFRRDEYRDIILGFNLSEGSGGGPSSVVLAHASLFPNSFVDSPKIVHSQHSLSRSIERVAFNPTNQRASAVRLCEGTARKLDDKQCQVMNDIREHSLDPLIGGYFISRFRVFTLLFGDIQWLTISLFFFGLSEVFGRYRRWVSPRATLYKRSANEGEDLLEPVKDLPHAFEKYNAKRVRSIPDRLFERAAVGVGLFSTPESEAHGGGAKTISKNPVSETTLEGYRNFLDAESGANMESLYTTNELVLKLAFAGTIWGIGSALFSARALDVSDPVLKILAKADMFGSIGTAFGTTLLGVMLSAILSVLVQSLASSWRQKINVSYLNVLSLRDQIRDLRVDPALRPNPPSPRKADFLANLGALVVFLIGALVLYLLFFR